jgi:hypothetical protein
MQGGLFGDLPGLFKSKQDKPDTAAGWSSVHSYAANGAPLPFSFTSATMAVLSARSSTPRQNSGATCSKTPSRHYSGPSKLTGIGFPSGY